MLAAGIGNIHGKYPANWKGLSFDTLAAIQEKTTTMPLVLHGGSGIPEETLKQAVQNGICKANFNTELQLGWHKDVLKFIENNKDVYDPRKVISSGEEGLKNVAREYIRILGSKGKA